MSDKAEYASRVVLAGSLKYSETLQIESIIVSHAF
jgi:hypothetical protein